MTGAFVIKGHKTLFGLGEDRNGVKFNISCSSRLKTKGDRAFWSLSQKLLCGLLFKISLYRLYSILFYYDNSYSLVTLFYNAL